MTKWPSVILLDRDGVINEDRPDYVKTPDEFNFLPGALEAIGRLTSFGYRLFVVSNQSAVGRGLMTIEALRAIERKLLTGVAMAGGRLEAIAYCLHRPDEGCACRKPKPGLLRRMAEEHGFRADDALLIGDAVSDIQVGKAFGCQTVLVQTGRGMDEWTKCQTLGLIPDYIQPSLAHVADWLTTRLDYVRSYGLS